MVSISRVWFVFEWSVHYICHVQLPLATWGRALFDRVASQSDVSATWLTWARALGNWRQGWPGKHTGKKRSPLIAYQSAHEPIYERRFEHGRPMWLQGVIENNHGSPEFLCMSISIHAVIPPPHWVMCPTNFENKRVPALEQGLQNFHCMRKNVARQCSQPRQLEVDSAWHRVFAFLLEICQFWNSFRMKQENIHH